MTLLNRAERSVRWQAMVGAILAIVAGQLAAGALLLAALVVAPLLRRRKRPLILPHWLVNIAVALTTVWLAASILWPGGQATGGEGTAIGRLLMVVTYLCVLQALRAFEAVKTPRDVGQTVVLSLIMVAIASLCGWGLMFGIGLLAYLFLGGYAVVLLNIAGQSGKTGASERSIPGSMRGLRGVVIRSIVGVLLISTVVFVLFPRLQVNLWPVRPLEGTAITGFDESDRMTLGDINRIQQDKTPIMWVWVRRRGQAVGRADSPLYLRGKTFDTYVKQYNSYIWKDSFAEDRYSVENTSRFRLIVDGTIRPTEPLADLPMREYIIELQDRKGHALFAPYPAFSILGRNVGAVEHRAYDATLWLPKDQPRKGRMMYSVMTPDPVLGTVSDVRPAVARLLAGEASERYKAHYSDAGMLDGVVSEKVRRFVDETILAGRSITDHYKIAREIETYLRNNYAYSRSFDPLPEGVEPIEAFLSMPKRDGERSQGRHCEYFAAAMTVLCRSKNIPSRLVAGFRSGEFNSVDNFYLIRRKHAHSWVEVFIDGRDWVTFDPTPADDSPEGGWTGWLTQFVDYLRASWRHNIDEYGAEHQSWLRKLINSYTRRAGSWTNAQKERLERWLEQFVGDAAACVGTVLVIGAGVLVFGGLGVTVILLLRRRRRRTFDDEADADAAPAGRRRQVDFYLRLLELLARRGYTKAAGATAQEFTDHLARIAATQLPIEQIRRIVRCYNLRRYGERELSDAQTSEIHRTLDFLAAESVPGER